jgi:hypothetical protein
LVWPVFEAVRNNPDGFMAAHVDGNTVVWPNGADLGSDVLTLDASPREVSAPDRLVLATYANLNATMSFEEGSSG